MTGRNLGLLFVCNILSLIGWSSAATCVKKSPCLCEYDDGSGAVDLTNLAGSNGPRLKDAFDTQHSLQYSYNPCKPFSEGSCSNVAVCETTTYGGGSFTVSGGTQDSAKFITTGDKLTVSYTTRPGEYAYTTAVTLKCDASVKGEPKFEVKGAVTPNSIEMSMTHADCCPFRPGGGGLSIGSILCIIFFVGIACYFIVGALFLFFVKKESGQKVVPNVKFWTAIPGYVKDGGQFAYNRVRGGNQSEYQNI